MSVSELIESFVPVLGFPPEDGSLFLAIMRRGVLSELLRIDLEGKQPAVAHLAAMATRSGGDGVVAVVLSAEPRSFDVGQIVEAVSGELFRAGLPLAGAYVVDRLAAGGRWRSVGRREETGVLGDPAQCAMAPDAVSFGRRQYRSRQELAAVVESHPNRVAKLRPLLTQAAAARGWRRAVRASRRAAHRLAAGETLHDAELAAIGASLLKPKVRDALIAATVSDAERAGPAEELWTLLTRVLPAPWRAEALVLVAIAAYVRGDGPLASAATLAALAVDVDHQGARQLDIALHFIGLHPEEVRRLLSPSWRHRRPGFSRLPAEVPAHVRAAASRQL
ncbi:DUF4192 domain-containing protein [Mycobacterium sp.]|uniref:DUF4192 domain-containing protein n=1 Tax=Mycobacterium sp. TaxID=1785 RepID=UPI0025E0E950|nr:DUF4192 domain-containing protein [Mycobacterium sp.]